MAMKTPLRPDERIVRKGWVNLMRGWEGVGGRLYLTTRRLVFESHRINVQTGTTEIPLADVRGTQVAWSGPAGWTVKLAPTTLLVHTTSGRTHQVITWRRRTWATAIEEQRRALP